MRGRTSPRAPPPCVCARSLRPAAMSALARPTLCSLRPPRLATGTRAAKRYVRRPEIVFFEPSFAFRRRVTFVVSCGGRGFRVRRGRDSPHAPRGVVCHELRLGQVPYRASGFANRERARPVVGPTRQHEHVSHCKAKTPAAPVLSVGRFGRRTVIFLWVFFCDLPISRHGEGGAL